MHRIRWLALGLGLIVPLGTPVDACAATEDEREAFFEIKIRPILAGTCFPCHGGKKTSAGLRVDSRASLLRGGDTGPALIPGDADASLLIGALRQNEDLKMPPGKKLDDAVVNDFRTWIRQGAAWPEKAVGADAFNTRKHWAFLPIRAEEPSGSAPHPIDRFLEGKWHEQDLHPLGGTSKRTLLRRVTFDLIGLPPTPEEMDAFLTDELPGAFERVVERLLASPLYGERWGRYWLDVARYADTAGDNADYPIPEVRLYRDYVIDAFNDDKPYDQFVQEQLAGDLLARQGPSEVYAKRVAATGFLALSRRYATAPQELWHLTLEDTIETTGAAFLGLTLRCARCHDHKFDPVTQRDYYALYGIFSSTKFPYAGSEEFQSKGFPRANFMPLAPPEEAKPRMAAFESTLQRLRADIERADKEDPLALKRAELAHQTESLNDAIRDLEAQGQTPLPFRAHLATLQARRADVERQLQAKLEAMREEVRKLQRAGLPPDVPGAYAVQEGPPVDEALQVRGEPGQRGAVVPRGVPTFLAAPKPSPIPASESGRLQLAQWLTRPDHPLTARVMVNRIWQHHFGRGLVATPSNFGLRGEEPTHPELLDWLADRFIKSGWSIKAMHRLILCSRAYQRDSGFDAANAAKDPDNRCYWRFDRHRLDAEAIRDSLLALGGHLALDRPGTHPFPPIAQWNWTQHTPFKAVYPSNHRSVYLMTQRLQRHPFLALFDGPDTNHTTDARPTSIVPLQALYALNNAFVGEQAEGFGQRLLAASPDAHVRLGLAYELAWGRPPNQDEEANAKEYIRRFGEALVAAGAPTERRELENWTSFARVLLMANEFLYVD